jgi:hypothetical protein
MIIKTEAEMEEKLIALHKGILRNPELNWCLNSGGCAFFAVEVAKALPFNVIGLTVFDDVEHDRHFKRALEMINSSPKRKNTVDFWNNNCVDFCHVVLTIMLRGRVYVFDGLHGLMLKETYIDRFGGTVWSREAEGRKSMYFPLYGFDVGVMPVELMKPLVKTGRGWNQTFKSKHRREAIRMINGHLREEWNS